MSTSVVKCSEGLKKRISIIIRIYTDRMKIYCFFRILLVLLFIIVCKVVQGGSNMTGTDLCVNKCKQSRSYLNHLVQSAAEITPTFGGVTARAVEGVQ